MWSPQPPTSHPSGGLAERGGRMYGMVSPPLPLMRVQAFDLEAARPHTISGEPIPSISNVINPHGKPSIPASGIPTSPLKTQTSTQHPQRTKKTQPTELFPPGAGTGAPLHDPIVSRRIAKWFVARSAREANLRQTEAFTRQMAQADAVVSGIALDSNETKREQGELWDYLVYESHFHLESAKERQLRTSLLPNEEELFATHIQNHTAEYPNIADRASGIPIPPVLTPSLIFDAEFESGNLQSSTRVHGRETILSPKALELLQEYSVPETVDQEYDLVLRNDLQTAGNIQWYYFSVKTPPTLASQAYPLRVRFNIVNMLKKDSLYNYGMRPAVYSTRSAKNTTNSRDTTFGPKDSEKFSNETSPRRVLPSMALADWSHAGYDVCYYRNASSSVRTMRSRKKRSTSKTVLRQQYTLSFTYTFTSPDTVFFAHAFPYTYSDLQRHIQSLCQDSSLDSILHHRVLCETLGGNNLDVLTITERSQDVFHSRAKAAVCVTARVHPGEPNSSYMIHGLIDFLLSDTEEARALRSVFIFTIVPMLNPDGVIHGNYRCSLAATDLNRRYAATHRLLHPTIAAVKDMVKRIQRHRTISLFIDLHGHSRAKNAFVYGCDIHQQPEKYVAWLSQHIHSEAWNARRVHCRIFPKILCALSNAQRTPVADLSSIGLGISSQLPGTTSNTVNSGSFNYLRDDTDTGDGGGYFSYRDCTFHMSKSKFGTGRVVYWKDLGIPASYTIEASFCGNGDNSEGVLLRSKSVEGLINWHGQTSDGTGKLTSLSYNSNDLLISQTELDSRIQRLLANYRTARHYGKEDLQAIGRHIGLSIYYYANLSHSHVSADMHALAEEYARVHGGGLTAEETAAAEDNLGDVAECDEDSLDYLTGIISGTDHHHDSCEGSESDEPATCHFVPSPTQRQKNKQCSSSRSKTRNGKSGKKASKGSSTPAVVACQQAVYGDFLASSGVVTEESIAATQHVILRPTTFSTSVLADALASYGDEFLTTRLTKNVSLRLKCEIAVQQALRLTDISALAPAGLSETTLFVDQSADADAECVDSDSCPSDDNDASADLLRHAKKLGNARDVGGLLRSSLKARKKREVAAVRKQQQVTLQRIAKDIELARQIEPSLCTTNEANTRPKTRATSARLNRLTMAVNRRLSTPVPPLPAFPFNLRQPPEPPRNNALQIKMMNFTDLDEHTLAPNPAYRRPTTASLIPKPLI